MRDYCGEILKKQKILLALFLSVALSLCIFVFYLLIQYSLQEGFALWTGMMMAIVGIPSIALLIKCFPSSFRSERQQFSREILKQHPEEQTSLSLEHIFDEINADLNQNGEDLEAFLLGQKWLLVTPCRMSSPYIVDLSFLQSFAAGTTQFDNRRKRTPAIVMVSKKLGPLTCQNTKPVVQRCYAVLAARYPHLTCPGDEDVDLDAWTMRQFRKALMASRNIC